MKNRSNIIKVSVVGLIFLLIVVFAFLTGNDSGKENVNEKAKTEIITNVAPAVSIDTTDVSETVVNTNPFAGRYADYQGISSINPSEPTYLINPATNDDDLYMEFVVTEGDEVLYSSELVEAGKSLSVIFSDFLSEGEHDLTITMNPYLLVDGEFVKAPVNNAQQISVTV